MSLKNLGYKYCGSKSCKWVNSDGTCTFTECIYEEEDEWEGFGRG